MKRREMGKVKRMGTVNKANRIGRNDAIKKRSVTLIFPHVLLLIHCSTNREMIAASKRRKEKGEKDPDQSSQSESEAGP